ncbi:MAG: hypothetical protein JW915_05255 [Chitinispirillaceae bacterium]|nr:hypothetical protein [Chitinispirillaceae bacterium]
MFILCKISEIVFPAFDCDFRPGDSDFFPFDLKNGAFELIFWPGDFDFGGSKLRKPASEIVIRASGTMGLGWWSRGTGRCFTITERWIG